MSLSILFDLGDYGIDRNNIGGVGLRAVELAETLSESFNVRVLAPGSTDPIYSGSAVVEANATRWAALLADADVVMFFDMPDGGRLEQAVRARRIIVSENAPPIEQLEYPRFRGHSRPVEHHQGLVSSYRRQLEVSHHFLSRSKVERSVLLGNLCISGRLSPSDLARSRTVDHLVTMVPLGFSRSSAERARTAPVAPIADFLWTGGIWILYDPELIIRAIGFCHRTGYPVSVAFLYAQELSDNADLLQRIRSLIGELGLQDSIILLPSPPAHEERDSLLRGARALVCIGRPGIENETCVRLRIRDSRLYDLPMIIDRHGWTGAELAADGLARVLENDSPQALAELLLSSMDYKPQGSRTNYCYVHTLSAFENWLKGYH